MILDKVVISEFRNLQLIESGIDSFNLCLNKQHYVDYPKEITYSYNSRGFRDADWPIENLSKCIWCIGDSFTVGLGQPQHEIWPSLLHKKSKLHTINVSMDGASNMWMARMIEYILLEVSPDNIVVQWSYAHRREDPDPSKDDRTRRILSNKTDTVKEDIENLFQQIKKIESISQSTNIIHSFIPKFIDEDKIDIIFARMKKQFSKYNIVYDCKQLDFARDYHHYDIETSAKYSNHFVNLIK